MTYAWARGSNFAPSKNQNNNIIKRYKSCLSAHTRQTTNETNFLPADLNSQAEQFAIVKIFTHAIADLRKGERIQNQTNSGSHHLEAGKLYASTNWADNRTIYRCFGFSPFIFVALKVH